MKNLLRRKFIWYSIVASFLNYIKELILNVMALIGYDIENLIECYLITAPPNIYMQYTHICMHSIIWPSLLWLKTSNSRKLHFKSATFLWQFWKHLGQTFLGHNTVRNVFAMSQLSKNEYLEEIKLTV